MTDIDNTAPRRSGWLGVTLTVSFAVASVLLLAAGVSGVLQADPRDAGLGLILAGLLLGVFSVHFAGLGRGADHIWSKPRPALVKVVGTGSVLGVQYFVLRAWRDYAVLEALGLMLFVAAIVVASE